MELIFDLFYQNTPASTPEGLIISNEYLNNQLIFFKMAEEILWDVMELPRTNEFYISSVINGSISGGFELHCITPLTTWIWDVGWNFNSFYSVLIHWASSASFSDKFSWINSPEIPSEFIPQCLIYITSALVQVMACHLTGDKPSSEPMLTITKNIPKHQRFSLTSYRCETDLFPGWTQFFNLRWPIQKFLGWIKAKSMDKKGRYRQKLLVPHANHTSLLSYLFLYFFFVVHYVIKVTAQDALRW